MTRARLRGCLVAAVAAAALVGSGCSSSSSSSSTAASGPGTTAAVTSTSTSTTAPAATGVVVQAGINDPANQHVAVMEFMPAKVTVHVGTPVTWVWDGAMEPHSVTFLPGDAAPPAKPDQKLFAPTPPTGPYDGTTLVNSGLQPLGPGKVPPFKLTFGKVGTYHYHCVIHPEMIGTVVVTAATGPEDTPAVVAAQGKSEQAQWVAEGEAAAATLSATKPAAAANADGTTTWTVQMGASAPHADVMAFSPAQLNVKKGDRVTFVNNTAAPHTVTFFNGHPPIQDPSSPAASTPTGVSPITLNTTDLINTGVIPPDVPPGHGPPLAARSFTFVVPNAGTYSYLCIFHADQGMQGTIVAT